MFKKETKVAIFSSGNVAEIEWENVRFQSKPEHWLSCLRFFMFVLFLQANTRIASHGKGKVFPLQARCGLEGE